MKKLIPAFAAAVFAMTGTAAYAQEDAKQLDQPVAMTDAQMDNVAAGLITVVAVDVADIDTGNVLSNNQVSVPVNAAVNVLGQQASSNRSVIDQSQ